MVELLIIPAAIGFLIVIVRPAFGAYLLLAADPFIIGIARGNLNSVLRPNEALLLLVMGAYGARVLLLMLCQQHRPVPFDRADVALLCLVGTGSLMPLIWRWARDLPLTQDDVLYAAVLIKYYAMFRLVRSTVSSVGEVKVCLWLSIASALLVAIIAMLQVLDIAGVPEFLIRNYDLPFGPIDILIMRERGTSTVASSFGLGDMMMMNIILAIALQRSTRYRHWLLPVAAVVFLCGCVVAGEVSGYVGLCVTLLAFGWITGSLFRISLYAMGVACIAALPFWSVIARRIEGFQQIGGIPSSWNGRWANLQHSFFPRLFSDGNWLLGVQPAPRIPTPDPWRQFVYIESGYVWLLWIGGLPFAAAFIYFAYTCLKDLRTIARQRTDAVGTAAAASFSFLTAILVLMLFDPHLTLRGSADLFFPMLALSYIRPSREVARRSAVGIGPVAGNSATTDASDCLDEPRAQIWNRQERRHAVHR